MTLALHSRPFALDPTGLRLPWPSADGVCDVVGRWLGPLAEQVLGLTGLAGLHRRAAAGAPETDFAQRVLSALCVRWRPPAGDLAAIPKSGPLVVVANHPFGGLDGVMLLALIRLVRPDVKVLGNFLLARIPEMRPSVITVDPFGGTDSVRRNGAGLREALQWLGAGGVLAIFPAGEVAHYRWDQGRVAEPPWSDAAARLAMRAGCPVLPVHFGGRNSRWFELAGLVHPRLRTALLPRELLNKRGRRVQIAIGTPVAAKRLKDFGCPAEATDYLRIRTLILSGRAGGDTPELVRGISEQLSPLAAPPPDEPLRREVRQLCTQAARLGDRTASGLESNQPQATHAHQDRSETGPPSPNSNPLLLESGEFQVFCAPAAQIPTILYEFGRLREQTFRSVGEGTGKSLDLDRFDEHYLHLFVWDRRRQRVVGAYRLGLVDQLVERFGVEGLYTHTLFRFDERLVRRMGPAIELGRSFITPEYQRGYAPLLLLWKGIGRFAAANPRYRRLFGAVSISNEYQSMTQKLLVAFLQANNAAGDWAGLASPRNPPRLPRVSAEEARPLARVARDVGEVEELVREIESDQRGVPVLLRQYLRLNAKLLGFNVDRSFGNVLDGLLLVDLMEIDPVLRDRYLGTEGAAGFCAFHGATSVRERG